MISHLESNEILESLEEVFVGYGKEKINLENVRYIKVDERSFFLELEGEEDVDAVGALVGCPVLIPFDELGKLSEDEYYWRDVVGLEVVTEDGEILGRIEEIFPTGSNDVYVCIGGEREILLPAIADVIRKIDIKNGRMVVRLLEGL